MYEEQLLASGLHPKAVHGAESALRSLLKQQNT
jgi:hypothetical protein